MEVKFTVHGAKELAAALEKINKKAPTLIYDACVKTGNQFRKDVVNLTKEKTEQHTGNLYSGYVASPFIEGYGSNRTYGSSVSGGNKSACHFHLIENGHERIEQNVKLNIGGKREFRHINPGFTNGIHTMQDTKADWMSSDRFDENIRKAIKKAVKMGIDI